MTFEEARQQLLTVLSSFLDVPLSTYKTSKIIHDPIWGTCEYYPWEAALLDLPLFQRLRGLKQTGLAYLTYPAAEHSRFQHTLGVIEAATQVFDSLCNRWDTGGATARLRSAGAALTDAMSKPNRARNRAILRLAAMVHDTGHSILSHTSERIFALTTPFQDLAQQINKTYRRNPGAAEVVVYLLVTSDEWFTIAERAWRLGGGPGHPPQKEDWQRVGRWVMGIEPEPMYKHLCDIVSGPIDADKLDYVSRDAYFAGIPISYDLHRFVSTVCIDLQTNPQTGTDWVRLTLPLGKGVNALEQLVMSRLVLFSYLYHHQKVRAAEATFERILAREFLKKGTIAGVAVWDLFGLQDAHIYSLTGGRFGKSPLCDIVFRSLPVRVIEFRKVDVVVPNSPSSQAGFEELYALGQPESWDEYAQLIRYEDSLATAAGAPPCSVVVDFPKEPRYADLGSLRLPSRDPDESPSVKDHLAYQSWIDAYSQYRLYCRVFCARSTVSNDQLWDVLVDDFRKRGLDLKKSTRVH